MLLFGQKYGILIGEIINLGRDQRSEIPLVACRK